MQPHFLICAINSRKMTILGTVGVIGAPAAGEQRGELRREDL